MTESKGTALVPSEPRDLSKSVDAYSRGLNTYLESLNLPTENVLVPVTERGRVLNNLPSVLETLPMESRVRSLYISKFVAACGAGLFDAALNFVWDETVASLSEKVAQFDLEYFYSSTITDPDRRKKFRDEKDLEKLEDWELIRGCHLIGILSDIGFRHLDYIRNMRNWASAAHPNQNQITGFQIISWLETCIIEVISKAPSAPAIEVKRLLHNLRSHSLASQDVDPIIESIRLLPDDLAKPLLRTIFGMFTDPDVAVTVKNNIRLIARAVWNRAPIETKQECGIKYSNFAANADIPRKDAARDFLQTVDGLSFLPKDTLALEMSDKTNALFNAHIGFNNFHTEPAHARDLLKYVSASGTIPDAVRYQYVKTVTMCYIGNGYGVSHAAYSYYEGMIGRFQDHEFWIVAHLLQDGDFASRLQFTDCRNRFRPLIRSFLNRTSNEVIKAVFNFILSQTDEQLPNCGKSTQYKRILAQG